MDGLSPFHKVGADGEHIYSNEAYHLLKNNCMTVSFDTLKQGTLSSGIYFKDFVEWDGFGSIRPNDFRVNIRETFANQNFTKDAARKSAIGNIGKEKPWYMSQNYYTKGQTYGKMLRGY